jgi:hypothetical protein
MAFTVPVKVWEWANRIHGWLDPDEAALLWTLCESPWCEIGAHRGRSSYILASKGPGIVIDHFRGTPNQPLEKGYVRDSFDRNMRDMPVTVLEAKFADVADKVGEIRFLHLDADHSYAATRRAFELYAPKLAVGCHVVLHDAVGDHWPGVARFAATLHKNDDWEHVADVNRSAAFRRVA